MECVFVCVYVTKFCYYRHVKLFSLTSGVVYLCPDLFFFGSYKHIVTVYYKN